MLWMKLGALFMLLSVAMGAFGAHALKNKLTPEMLIIFETAVRYQTYHALALLFLGIVSSSHSRVWLVGWCFSLGILIFSGSLYVLSLTGVKGWGAITPIGGVLFVLGWLILFFRLSIKS